MHDVFRNLLIGLLRRPMIWRLGMLVALFAVIFMNVRPGEIIAAFKFARPGYLLIALLMMIPSLFLQTYKWNFLLRTTRPRPTVRTAFRSLLGGFFLGAVSPARTGELGRGFFIPGHSKMRIASLTVLDKGFNHATTYTATFIALFLALPMPYKLIPLATGMVMFVILVNFHRLRPLFRKICRRFSKEKTVENAMALFDALSRNTVLGMTALSIAFFLTYTIQFFVIINCFTDFPWRDALKTIPIIYGINLVMPITIGDLGVKEMASVEFLGPFGVPGGAAVSASLTQNVMTFLVPSLFGGLILLAGNRRRSSHELPHPPEDRSSDG